ncbi:MAG: PTS fructose transporter subunit IIA [Chromatiales bacterium]|jgi:PTS system ascorbate-specific IIA component|nr:PTS fructose transporter subunit IIA [Chromatiales bacterium]
MSVGLCLVTHDHIGSTILAAAVSMLGRCPLPVTAIPVISACDPADAEALLCQALQAVRDLDEGDGVIVLTDMFGSTPSNIAAALSGQGIEVAVVAGLNLPMLVRLLNYPGLELAQLAEKAVSGGVEGIFRCCGNSEV